MRTGCSEKFEYALPFRNIEMGWCTQSVQRFLRVSHTFMWGHITMRVRYSSTVRSPFVSSYLIEISPPSHKKKGKRKRKEPPVKTAVSREEIIISAHSVMWKCELCAHILKFCSARIGGHTNSNRRNPEATAGHGRVVDRLHGSSRSTVVACEHC